MNLGAGGIGVLEGKNRGGFWKIRKKIVGEFDFVAKILA